MNDHYRPKPAGQVFRGRLTATDPKETSAQMDDFAVLARFLLAEYLSRTTLLTDWFVTPYEERFSNWDIIKEASKTSAAAKRSKSRWMSLAFNSTNRLPGGTTTLKPTLDTRRRPLLNVNKPCMEPRFSDSPNLPWIQVNTHSYGALRCRECKEDPTPLLLIRVIDA